MFTRDVGTYIHDEKLFGCVYNDTPNIFNKYVYSRKKRCYYVFQI